MRRALSFPSPNFVGDETPKDKEVRFYAFLESVDLVRAEALIEGPGGGRHRAPPSLGEKRLRLRFSGFEGERFDAAEGSFERLDPGRAALPEQRRRRREQLADLFRDAPVPVIQIETVPTFWGEMDRVLSPARWFWMALRSLEGLESEPYVLVGEPDDESEDSLFALAFLAPVNPNDLMRLRNVFSLAHVPDLGGDGDEGGEEPEPVPPKPDDGLRVMILSDPQPGPRPMDAALADSDMVEVWDPFTAPDRSREQPLRPRRES